MLFIAIVAAPVALGADGAAAVVTGVSDQRAAFFESPAYRALALDSVRLIVPWDAGVRAGTWDAWLTRAERDGADVMVALEHDAESRCPDRPCALPSVAAYRAALAALIGRYPSIRTITPWNEPNHSSQPTFAHPDAAATYFQAARATCPSCVIVAGDFLDDSALPAYLSSYKAALTSTPDVWGLHNYFDSTYLRSRGVETMLRQTSGGLWLTETGGIVSFTPPGGGGMPYDENRAAGSVAWLYELADEYPRIERMYLYQWQGTPDNAFDSGLLGYDGRPRPAYDVVAAQVGPRGSATPPSDVAARGSRAAALARRRQTGSQGRGAILRFDRRLRLLAGGRLAVRGRCVVRSGGSERCRRRVVVRVAGTVVARLRVDIRGGRRFVRAVRLTRWARVRLASAASSRVELQSCRWTGHRCAPGHSIGVLRTVASPGSSSRHAALGR